MSLARKQPFNVIVNYQFIFYFSDFFNVATLLWIALALVQSTCSRVFISFSKSISITSDQDVYEDVLRHDHMRGLFFDAKLENIQIINFWSHRYPSILSHWTNKKNGWWVSYLFIIVRVWNNTLLFAKPN